MLIFAPDSADGLAASLARALDAELSPLEWRRFDDGEFKIRPLVSPRGEDVYVVHSLHGEARRSPADKLLALLVLLGALKDHGAARVTAVVPYLAFQRKDRRTQPFDPLTSRTVAQMFETVGTHRLIALEPHNVAAFDNAFRCPVLAVPGHRLFDPLLDELRAEPVDRPLVVASPDPGGIKRAQLWREHAESRLQRDVGFAFIEKRRTEGEISGSAQVAGDVAGATVLLVDDLVATGHTLLRAARSLRAGGAARVVACAPHGLFVGAADHSLGDPVIDQVVTTDSVSPLRVAAGSPLRSRLRIVSCVPVLADALRELHAPFEA